MYWAWSQPERMLGTDIVHSIESGVPTKKTEKENNVFVQN
jgi:hypothetical protein